MRLASVIITGILLLVNSINAQLRPNIIYIMADDMGYADLSVYGRKDYQTPNIDRLAQMGTRFTQAYSAAPLCTPSRTAFMTGRYPARTPVGLKEPLEWSALDSAAGLSPDYPSIATMLRNAGYTTHLVGKWHLGFTSPFSPIANGFDDFFGSKGGGVDYTSHTNPRNEYDLYENDEPAPRQNGYMTELLAERAASIIRRRHKKPYFLSLMFTAPHWPWQSPGDSQYALGFQNWRPGGSPATYAKMMKALDDAVSTILKAVEQSGLSQSTLIIFTSDNGGERYSDMGPFTAGKPVLWEGGIHMPAIICWPEKIPSNRISSQPIITMNWTATILALAQANADPRFAPDGINILPFCTGESKPVQRTFYWRVTQRNQQKAIRHGDWKYLKDEKGEYLFNIEVDPGEKNDRKSQEPVVVERLRKMLAGWEATLLEPLPLR